MDRSKSVAIHPQRALTLLIVLAMLGALLAMIPITAGAQQATQNETNVQLIVDSSGSMGEEIEPGETRVQAAKGALNDVIDILPTNPGINVGLRIYGHEGNNTQAGRPVSCQSSELVVPMAGVDKDALRAEVDGIEPVGWTPIALSLNRAAADFPAASDTVKNAVILVTDGLETCGGNPCTASRNLITGDGQVVTHVIGFALREDERANLQCIVDESGGLLLGADNADQLRDAIFTVLEEAEVVVTSGELEIESIGGLYPRATVTGATEADDSNPNATTFSAVFGDDSNVLVVPAGTYVVAWINPSGSTSQVTVLVEANQRTVIRGSILRFPQGNGEVYVLSDQAGIEIWRAPVEFGDHVWILPGVYRLKLAETVGDAAILSLDVQTLPGSVTQIDVTVTP
ncbi:MAG: VWA domain-containing protein [Thermomicrobiales bacterium]